MFSDSIDNNVEILDELIRNTPPSQRQRCRIAADKMERAFQGLQKDYPRDPAIALGAAWAIYKIAQKLVEQAKEGKSDSLIQLIG